MHSIAQYIRSCFHVRLGVAYSLGPFSLSPFIILFVNFCIRECLRRTILLYYFLRANKWQIHFHFAVEEQARDVFFGEESLLSQISRANRSFGRKN